jgi:uncharacterized membrane protein YraQ (UPF0718 family)
MADVRELPELVREFVDMSKDYMRQETLEPAKLLGRFAGYALGAAVAFSFAALFLSVAGVRYIRELLPEGPYWSALGYIIAAVILAIIAAVIVRLTNREIPVEELKATPLIDEAASSPLAGVIAGEPTAKNSSQGGDQA